MEVFLRGDLRTIRPANAVSAQRTDWIVVVTPLLRVVVNIWEAVLHDVDKARKRPQNACLKYGGRIVDAWNKTIT